jgi:hypothetical protein
MVLELISLVALPPFALDFLILVGDMTCVVGLVQLTGTAFQGWTCSSLTIAVLIAGAMVWSVRN